MKRAIREETPKSLEQTRNGKEITMDKHELKSLVRGAYDIQKLRIQMGNRIVANLKARLGQAPGEKEDTMDAEGKNLLKRMRKRYAKLTDGVKTFPRPGKFKGNEVIATWAELKLVEQYVLLDKNEAAGFAGVKALVRECPLWGAFLEGVKGCGETMGGVILTEIDIHKAKYASSLWKYAGLDVAKDGKGRSKKKEHLIKVAYEDKDGKPAERNGITFNPFLKTKLTGVLAPCLIKAQKSGYVERYYEYKERLENHPAHVEKTKGHRNNMAKRYMIKLFLVDLYVHWRALEGLPVHPDYAEAKLGMRHGDKAA
jgi:hypothetical protein